MDNLKPEKKMINWNATPEEVRLIEALKQALGRSTTSDLLRHLGREEAKKICPELFSCE